jgi:hypothetical protein
MINTPRLASYHLVLRRVASLDTLLVSPESTSTYAGLQNALTLLSVSANSNSDTTREDQFDFP